MKDNPHVDMNAEPSHGIVTPNIHFVEKAVVGSKGYCTSHTEIEESQQTRNATPLKMGFL